MNKVSWAICRKRLVHPLGDRAAHPTQPDRVGRLLQRGSRTGAGDAGAAVAPLAINVRTKWATESLVTRCSIGSIGTWARSTPSRSARLRAATVAGCRRPPATVVGRTGWALAGGAIARGAVVGRSSRSAATMRPPGPVPCTVRRSMLRSMASRLVSGDATTRPVWTTGGALGAAGVVDVGAAAAAATGAAAIGSCRSRCLLTVGEKPADAVAAGKRLAHLTDAVETAGRRSLDVGLGLVGLDTQDRLAGRDRCPVVGEPLGDRALLHRQAELRHQEFSRHGRPFVGETRRTDVSGRRRRVPPRRRSSGGRTLRSTP